MNNEEILKKAIEKAVENSGKRFIKPAISYELIGDYYYRIIFSHEFAKAFWGDEVICPFHEKYSHRYSKYSKEHKEGDIVSNETVKENFQKDGHCGICWEKLQPRWQHHLCIMALEEEPLKYLEKFIK